MDFKHELHDIKDQESGLPASKKDHSQYDATIIEIDPVVERRVVRKIDMIVMSAMTFAYFFQYLDKQSINFAAIFGMSDDLQLTGQQFSWVVTIFYFGQLASEFLVSYLMSRFPVTKVVGVTM